MPASARMLGLSLSLVVLTTLSSMVRAEDSPFRTATTKRVVSTTEAEETAGKRNLNKATIAKVAVLKRAPGSPTTAQFVGGPHRVVVHYHMYRGPAMVHGGPYYSYQAPWYIAPYHQSYYAPVPAGVVGYYGPAYYPGYYAPVRYYGPYYGGAYYYGP